MLILDAITKSALISGIEPEQGARVVSTEMVRNNSLNIYYKTNDDNRLMSSRLII
jgi:hypothetical protein